MYSKLVNTYTRPKLCLPSASAGVAPKSKENERADTTAALAKFKSILAASSFVVSLCLIDAVDDGAKASTELAQREIVNNNCFNIF